MLAIHVLNVKHGDSIIIQYKGPSGTAFGVIDSNTSGEQEEPPALTKLRELGAEDLSFIALTHPHADHYTGLSKVIEAYKNRINSFYSFPLDHYLSGRIKKIAEVYQKIHNSVDSPTIKSDALEFVTILSLVKKYIGEKNWEEPNGFYNILAPVGFKDVTIAVLLPHSKVKGRYFEMIENSSCEIISNQNENNLSLAFSIKYEGHEIILGGDAPSAQWLDHKNYCTKRSIGINANVVKLPHHGAKKDCSTQVIDHLFNAQPQGIACISANGQTHPHFETLDILSKKGVVPYCTNLSRKCGNNIQDLFPLPQLSPELARFIKTVISKPTDRSIQPCQGDITILIDNNKINITSEYNHPCPYRGEYDFLV